MYRKTADGKYADEQGNIVELFMKDGVIVDAQGNKAEIQEAEPQDAQNQLRLLQQENALLKQKAGGLDALMEDEEFQSWAYDRERRRLGGNTTPVSNQQQPIQAPAQDRFAEFENAEGLRALVEEVTSKVLGVVQPQFESINKNIGEKFDPLLRNLSQNKIESEFGALVQQASTDKANYPVDPAIIRKEIDFERQKNPNLSMVNAYDLVAASMNRQGLVLRPPIQPTGSGSQEGGKGANVLLKPAGGQATANTTAGKTTLDVALEAKLKGGEADVRQSAQDLITIAAKKMEEDGRPIDLREL